MNQYSGSFSANIDRFSHDSMTSRIESWIDCIYQSYLNCSHHIDSELQYRFQFLAFLRRHRLEGLFSVGQNPSQSLITQRVILDVSSRYRRREDAQRLLWQGLKAWSRDNGANIEPIKGIALLLNRSLSYYPHFYEDIDIIVDDSDLGAIIGFLTLRGFVGNGGLNPKQALLCVRSLKCLNFCSAEAICSIDIHIDAVPRGLPGSLLRSDFESRPAVSALTSEERRKSLVCQQALLIINCFKNNWQRLDRVLDIDLIDHVTSESERSKVRELMNEWGYLRIYQLTFLLIERLRHAQSEGPKLQSESDVASLTAHDREYADRLFNNWFLSHPKNKSAPMIGVSAIRLLDGRIARKYFYLAKAIFPTQNDIRFLPIFSLYLLPFSFIRVVRISLIKIQRSLEKMFSKKNDCTR